MEAGKGAERKSEGPLTFTYDDVGDILYVDAVKPYADQESDELDDDIVARRNPITGTVENLEILFFARRLLRHSPPVISRLSELFTAPPAAAHATSSAKPHPH